MRIKNLEINNWQVIREANFNELGDLVVIAGPNGVGKTKIKEAIVYIFQNGGSPPAGSKVVLEATSKEERDTWGKTEFSLPQGIFASIFNRQNKRLKTNSRLIQVDSNRNIDSFQFQQLAFNQIGNPAEETVAPDYGTNLIKNRFVDICRTLHRLKSQEVLSVYKEYGAKMDPIANKITIDKQANHIEKYVTTFGELLYPKKMCEIDLNSTTIQYRDDDGNIRPFSYLSSGEKEVVILAFDILAQYPSDCIILIDEPEVHLHPELAFRLMKVLSSIGERNQLFLFTHSADIIANALESGVYFIRPKSAVLSGDQVVMVNEANIDAFKTIPNIRETLGTISLGKKILFVEGTNTSIDRNVFATLAKSSKDNIAIIPSESCSNINNMALVAESIEKGILGVELFMVRDRDGLTESQISIFSSKSNNRLIFLPFYHIENAFLVPGAIAAIASKILLHKAPDIASIEEKLVNLARNQITFIATQYVKHEIYFSAGNFDVSPKTTIASGTSITDIASSMNERKTELLDKLNEQFNYAHIESRLHYWQNLLTDSIASGWSPDARKFFFGKRILREMQQFLFGTKNIVLWEHIVQSDDSACLEACKELKEIILKV
ncbi:MAG: AAA family ATPase [Bacteroidota bacterium]